MDTNAINYKSRVESAIDVIGNYKQLNPKNCGISRLSPQVDTNCFERHKELLPSLKNARNITIGEAPWMVLLSVDVSATLLELNQTISKKSGCGGSLIANQWILTAAHCLVGDNKINIKIEGPIEIFFGFDTPLAESNEWYVHPNYNRSDEWHRYDIGLIKLKKPINTTVYEIKSENNICLPESREKFNENEGQIEYGMIAGWSRVEPPFLLQISYWSKTYWSFEENFLYADKLDNQLTCHGDSGSPLWQYHMGRAVIIGIVSFGLNNITTGCMMEEFENDTAVPLWATPVSLCINWIMNVTELN